MEQLSRFDLANLSDADTTFRGPTPEDGIGAPNRGQWVLTRSLWPLRERFGYGPYRTLYNAHGEKVAGNKGWAKSRIPGAQAPERDDRGAALAPCVLRKVTTLALPWATGVRLLRVVVTSTNRDCAEWSVAYRWASETLPLPQWWPVDLY